MLLISTAVGIGRSRDACNGSLEGRVTASTPSSSVGGMIGSFEDFVEDFSAKA